SLYGKGPACEVSDETVDLQECLYEHSKPGFELFRLGATEADALEEVTFPSTANDLPRRHDLTAVIGDDRNDENLIIAQLTVLFLKFHNRMLDMIDRDPMLQRTIPGSTIFAKTRRFVQWHYQYLVVNRLVNQVILDRVFNEVFGSQSQGYVPKLYDAPGPAPASPVEFTMAAFRFGHSMVRNGYRLNGSDVRDRPLLGLLRHEPRRIRGSEVIDWGL